MQLPERFVITISGKLWKVCERANMTPGELPSFLTHLLTGHDMDLALFTKAFGLRVEVETDTDQGEDGPDYLSLPRG